MDYRKNHKVIKTLTLEDQGQDFTEIDVLDNGVILGTSIMFKDGRLTMIGIGTLDGMDYWDTKEVLAGAEELVENLELDDVDVFIYFKDTEDADPLPWEANTLKYKVTSIKKATKPNRFINTKK